MSVVKRLVQRAIALAAVAAFVLLGALVVNGVASSVSPAKGDSLAKTKPFNQQLFERGRQIFRFDTFGDQAFWGGQLRLHQAIAGAKNGGVGPGVSPKTALALGLKVDATAIPAKTAAAIKAGKVNLDDPAATLTLLKLNAVVGIKGFFNSGGQLTSMGTTCALCHSTVDDSFAKGIGRRRDGWPNRDLNVGAIVAAAPTVKPYADLLGVDEA